MTQSPTITIEGTFFCLAIPGPERGVHHVRFPISRAKEMARWLSARQHAQSRNELTIGTTASPTQQMVDEWLRADAQRQAEERDARLAAMAEEAGISAEEIDALQF